MGELKSTLRDKAPPRSASGIPCTIDGKPPLSPIMKRPHLRIYVVILLAIICIPLGAEDGSIALFNGKNLSGWKNPYEWGKAEVVGDEIHLTADKKFFLVTESQYADFVFEGEVHLPEGQANSGFMFRCHVEPNKVFGYQAEIDGSDRRWSGGLYDEGRNKWLWPSQKGRTNVEAALAHEAESQAHFKKPEVRDALKRNDWNRIRITCRGNSIKIELNDVVTTEYTDNTDAKGFIGIQHHGEKGQTYRFRNLKIKELTTP